MTEYRIVNLSAMVEELGEDRVKSILSDFSCPINPDIEFFLSKKAIDFAVQGWAQTHLVYTQTENSEWVLVGYFALANKFMRISMSALGRSGSRLRSRIKYFATYDSAIRAYILPAPLIAQLGKNYTNGYNKLISGDDLLAQACKKISSIQSNMGGKFAYLECEDKPQLIKFYERNGFCAFDKRKMDKDEIGKLDGQYLVQMLKYFHRK
ncbi:MAG: N-acetyltransferase [Oscillospiraceae bacterium]|nr:N-acetyltransferase [Oscillospiraceae bacterium]